MGKTNLIKSDKMAENNVVSKGERAQIVVGHVTQAEADKHFTKKVEKERFRTGTKLIKLKNSNKIVGGAILGGVFGIYCYTMFSVRNGKLLEEFDKVPE